MFYAINDFEILITLTFIPIFKLLNKTKLLLLDEPTVGQDYHTLQKMMSLINEIHREQKNTIITITHDIRCKKALCDRELKLKDGVIVE